MKKMLSALLSTVLLLSLFGCGAAMNSGASADTQTNGFAFSDQNKYESSMGFDSAAPMEPESAAPGYNAVETPSSSLPENVKMIYRGYLYLESTAFDEAVEGLNQLVAKMGLSAKEDAYPCELSGGQQQRVSIARALALDPQVLFFDEPTSALDPELTGEILKVVRELAEEHMTMVVVTHEMAFARDLSDRIIFMDGGVIVEQGRAQDVISNPQQERTRAFLSRFQA